MIKNLLKILLIIDNIYGITPFLLKPSSCNYMLVKRIHNHPINKIMMTNKNNKIDMFNDHIYNKKNNSISDIKEDNNNIKNLFKNNSTKEIEYEDDTDKYFAKRHIFGLSDYDLAIYRISFYITVWICVMNHFIFKIL